MYLLRRSKLFEKSLKRIARAGDKRVLKGIEDVLNILASEKSLSVKHRDHALKGRYEGYRECHIHPDLLLIYGVEKSTMILVALDIGSHSYLFD